MKIFLHDRLVEQDEARISVFDHGLLYGDGIFEGIRIYDGCIFRLREHLERLASCARYIMLELPLSLEEIEAATIETVRANGLQSGYIRLVVTRGEGALGLLPYSCKKAGLFIIADDIALFPPEVYENGVKMVTSSTRRNNAEILNPRVKSLNYLNNILAKMEAKMAGGDEALMLDFRGFVNECSGDNVFIVKDGVITTIPCEWGALKGITRDAIIEIATDMGIEVREAPFTRFEIIDSDECFLTGTAAEVVAAVDLDGRRLGNGRPGQLTRKLEEEFRILARSDGVHCYREAVAQIK